jgi:hypothetical protein
MDWQLHSWGVFLALFCACSARPSSPGPRVAFQSSTGTSTRAAAPTTSAGGPSGIGSDAAVLPCLALSTRYARALAAADRTCHADRDCACVAYPPFLDVQVSVARPAAPELEAIAAAFRAEACPPVTVAQASTACRPACRKGYCASR